MISGLWACLLYVMIVIGSVSNLANLKSIKYSQHLYKVLPARTHTELSFDITLSTEDQPLSIRQKYAHLVHGRMPGEAADTNFIDLLLALS